MTGLTAKVVCNLEPLLAVINQPAENEARSRRPMQRAASVTAEADKWPAVLLLPWTERDWTLEAINFTVCVYVSWL